MNELQDVAETMLKVIPHPPIFNTFDQAVEWVRGQMPDETPQIIDGIAEHLVSLH